MHVSSYLHADDTFCKPIYTALSESYKSFKVLSNSISDGTILLGEFPQISLMVTCLACICALHTMNLCFAIKDLSPNHLVAKTVPRFSIAWIYPIDMISLSLGHLF